MRLLRLSCLLLTCLTQIAAADEYLTFYLGGQSNMDGYGYVSELPEQLNTQQDVMIFHGNGVFANQPAGGVGVWAKLRAGHGTGFSSDGATNNYSNRFGAELSFATAISKQFPGKKIAIIKYAVGGTGLHLKTGYGNWSPDFREGAGKNQYDFALNTINNAYAVSDIDGDGTDDKLTPAGIIWMQGEADAHTSEASANAYLANLSRLMGLLRAAFRKDDVPVVLGKITDSQMGEEDIMPFIKRVQLAQQMFVEQDVCAAHMTQSDDYGYDPKDAWHYNSAGYVSMGEDFAAEMVRLLRACK